MPSHVLRRHWESLTEMELDAAMHCFRQLFARPETTVMVARDEHGRPLAVAAAVIDDVVCLIELAVSSCHEASWALHDHLVRILIARRVGYLLASGGGPFGAVGFTTNVRRYQHLLGYELRHVIPAKAHPPTLRRRLLAALITMAAATGALIVRPAAASTTVHSSLVPVKGASCMNGAIRAVRSFRTRPEEKAEAIRCSK